MSEQDFRGGNNAPMFADTNTNWVRFMVDLNQLSTGGDAQNLSWNSTMILALDAQIDAAKRTAAGQASNMSVILSLVNFPQWANGTLGWNPNAPQANEQMYDRKGSLTSLTDLDNIKKPWCRIPDDLTTTGPWARILWTICQRYNQNNPNRPTPYCWIDAIDILNEPNASYFPQMAQAAGGDPYATSPTRTMGCSCVRMMTTAAAVINSLGGRPLILAPGLIDVTRNNNTRLATDAGTFIDDILGACDTANWHGGSNFIWSMHNYGDVLYQDYRVTTYRNKLVGKWAGWPGADVNNPQVWLNEGGVTMRDANYSEATQQQLLLSMWNRMNNDSAGAGMSLITQYLFNTDPRFDSGLRAQVTGAPRLAYNYPWKAITQFP